MRLSVFETSDEHVFGEQLPSDHLILFDQVPQRQVVLLVGSLVLEEIRRLQRLQHMTPVWVIIFRLQTVKVCFSHGIAGDKSTELVHLNYFFLVRK